MSLKERLTKYKKGVEWIAVNDVGSDDQTPETIRRSITVILLADVFGKAPEDVAEDVRLKIRSFWRAARSHGRR